MHLLTGSSANVNDAIIGQCLSQVTIKDGKDIQRFLLQEGDVVLLAKGNSIRAGYVATNIGVKVNDSMKALDKLVPTRSDTAS
ncbi:hypothetical protein [uncultured Paraglaciecola sp.]|uniref:hypothetical protein n=1 Tax=uncultured Paraglaciecola sp. TaxID=1765024 RepID=UPI0025928A9E|nr:hypothetical protein [uncultured Paraglaciecola sp.]